MYLGVRIETNVVGPPCTEALCPLEPHQIWVVALECPLWCVITLPRLTRMNKAKQKKTLKVDSCAVFRYRLGMPKRPNGISVHFLLANDDRAIAGERIARIILIPMLQINQKPAKNLDYFVKSNQLCLTLANLS